MKQPSARSRNYLILSMCIFGTVGIFRRYIDLHSSLIALVRGILGTGFLMCCLLLRRQRLNWEAVRKNFLLLLASGAAIGFNWILLFEAYCYTSVATATLCYYLAPTLVILASPVVLGERLTVRKSLCALAALLGMVFVSGIMETGFSGLSESKGIAFGLSAAVLYSSVILMNKKMNAIPALDQTIFQLGFASAAMVPYVLFTVSPAGLSCSGLSLGMLCILGTVHTGFAYLLYFGSMGRLKADTVALFSYIDPVLAILLSAVLLKEPLTPGGLVGAILILGAACVSQLFP